MDQARELAGKFLGGGSEAPAGDKQPVAGGEAAPGAGSWAATAERFLGGGERGPAQPGEQGQAPGGSGLGGVMGMAQEFLGGDKAAAGEGGAGHGASAAALLGAAQAAFGGSQGGQPKVGGGAEGGQAGAADAGLVDKLLSVFQQKEGKQFEGTESEYDKLAGMAHSVLGTPIGRDLLKMWVKQRLGI